MPVPAAGRPPDLALMIRESYSPHVARSSQQDPSQPEGDVMCLWIKKIFMLFVVGNIALFAACSAAITLVDPRAGAGPEGQPVPLFIRFISGLPCIAVSGMLLYGCYAIIKAESD